MSSRNLLQQTRAKGSRNADQLAKSARLASGRGARDPQPVSITLGPVSLDFISGSTAPWSLTLGAGSSVLLCLRGESFYTAQSQSFALGPRRNSVLLSAQSGVLLVGSGGLMAKVSLPTMVELREPPQGLRFDHLRRLLTHVASLYLDDPAAATDGLAEAYGMLLLETVRADISRAQLSSEMSVEQNVTRFMVAKDYIRAHLFERIRLSDVAQVLNISSRSVQLLFAQEAGESMTRYIARMRLEEAYQKLLNGDQNTNVTKIALDCGFTHAGLFSAAYRRSFGELPRDTLARAKRGSQGEIARAAAHMPS